MQIENEYGNIMANLTDAQSASEYIHWCAAMANKQNVGVPWIMCQQDADVPPNVVSFFFPNRHARIGSYFFVCFIPQTVTLISSSFFLFYIP